MAKLASPPNVQPYAALDNLATAQPAFPGANESRIYFDGAVLKVSLGGAPYVTIATGGGAATLQTAYTAGNSITIAGNLPVAIVGTGTAVDLRLDGVSAAGGLEMASAETLAVSALNEGRIRYNKLTQQFEKSSNNTAWAALGGAGGSLQAAYTAGSAIVLTGTNPITISNAAGVSSDFITLNELNTITSFNVGLAWTRNISPANATGFAGHAIAISNTPNGVNGLLNETAVGLISIIHAPVTGGGSFIGDNTIGINVSMKTNSLTTPGTMVGINVLMLNPNSSASMAGEFVSGSQNGTTAGIVRIANTANCGNPIMGLLVDFATSGVLTGADVTGIKIAIRSSTQPAISGSGAFVIDSQLKLANVIDCAIANTEGSAATIRYRAATALTAAMTGLLVDMSASTNAGAFALTGIAISLSTNAIGLSIAGSTTAGGIELGSSPTLAVGAGTVGRLRYNTGGSGTFEVSLNGAAYVPIATGAAAVTLQNTYTGSAGASPSIAINAFGPVSINNVAFGGGNLLTLNDGNLGSNSGVGMTWNRSLTPNNVTTYSGSAISIQNTPSATNASTEGSGTSALLVVNHAPTLAGGSITDKQIGISVSISPTVTGNTAVRGIVVTMSAFASTALAALFSGASISCPGAGGSTSERFGAGARAGGANSIGIGSNANAAQSGSIVIGAGSNANGGSGNSAICIGLSTTAAQQDCIAIGQFASVNGIDSGIAIGRSATTTGGVGNLCIGVGSTSGGQSSVAIGYQAGANNTNTVAVGTLAQASQVNATAIGGSANAAAVGSIAIGPAASVVNTSVNGIAIGTSSSLAGTSTSSIIIGNSLVVTNIVGQFVVGSNTQPIVDVTIGNGLTNAAPQLITYHATGGLGAGIAGASFIIAGGKSGDAATAGGGVGLQTTVAGAGQTLVTVLSVLNTGVVSITGSLAWTQTTQTAANAATYTFVERDATIFVDASALTAGQNYNVTLLTPVGRAGRICCIKVVKQGASTSSITVAAAAGNVENVASFTIPGNSFGSYIFQSDNANWWALGNV